MTGFESGDSTGEYIEPKRDWRGYVDDSIRESSASTISNPDYFSTDFIRSDIEKRVEYAFANIVDYSFLQRDINDTNNNANYRNSRVETSKQSLSYNSKPLEEYIPRIKFSIN